MSLVLAEQTNQTVAASKLALDSLAERIDNLKIGNGAELGVRTATQTMHQILKDKISGLPQIDVATIVAANGDVINFTRSFPAPPINLSDRDYFQAHRDNPNLAFFISTPVKNKGNGTWVFYLSRRLNDTSGRFMGLVLVGISVAKFTEFYERLGQSIGDGAAMTLYRRDFTVFTRWPLSEESIGRQNLTGTSHHVVETLHKRDEVIYTAGPRFSQGDISVARLGAVRLLDQFPLIVNLTVTEDLFLEGWRHVRALILTTAAASILTLLIAAMIMVRIARQREKSASLLHHLADQVPGALFQFQLMPDGKTMFPYVNRQFRSQYDIKTGHGTIPGELIFEHQHPDDAKRISDSIRESARTLKPWHEEYRVIFPEGQVTWRRGDASPEKLPDGSVLWHGYIIDVTEERLAQQAVHLAAGVFANSHDAIMIAELDGSIVDINAAFTRITGFSRDDAIGKNPRILKSGQQDHSFYVSLWQKLTQDGYWSGEVCNRRKDGTYYVAMQTISAVRDAQGETEHYVALFSDITALKEQQRQIEHIAHYDALTDLPNRALLVDRLRQALSQTQRRGQILAVVYIDLDGFKSINDSHGHHAGDQLLITVANRMKLVLREGDTLARIGGDEFVAILVDLRMVADAAPTLTRLLAAAAQPVQLGNISLQVSASLGVTFYPQFDEVDVDLLLHQADQAMYKAKLAGKNQYHILDTDHERSVLGPLQSPERTRTPSSSR